MTSTHLGIFLATIGAILLGTGVLHTLPKLGSAGRKLSEALCRAPLLDVAITYFLILPGVVGAIVAGWLGLGVAIVGQVVALQLWVWAHELAHPEARKGPRIVKSLNKVIGRWRNHLALWVTALAVPLFWVVRLVEIVVYPPLTVIIGLPRYRTADWVNLSRHKFKGLVGHDLIWCLYCDWMTGVWSLGSEMLRNVESFWCPIRFDSSKKCENCRIDFPDLDGTSRTPGWVKADATMAEVTSLIEKQYGRDRENSWFGHPARLTVEGKDLPQSPAN